MIGFRSLLITTCFGLGVGATVSAHADTNNTFRKSYTGGVGTSSRFGGGYSLDYGYALTKSGASASASGDAKAAGWVRLFGNTFDAVSVKASGTSTVRTSNPTCSAEMAYDTFLVGIRIPTLSGRIANGGRWANKKIVNASQQLIPGGALDLPLVSVAGVTVGVRGEAFANESVSIDGSLACTGVTATIRPGANVSAQGTFYLNFVQVVEAGVTGSVTFMDISLPTSLSAAWSYSAQPDFINGGTFCAWRNTSGASVNVDVTAVAGKIDAFVRIGLPCIDLLITRVCLNQKLTWNVWNTTSTKTRFPLDGTSTAPGLGDNTTACPPPAATPPVR